MTDPVAVWATLTKTQRRVLRDVAASGTGELVRAVGWAEFYPPGGRRTACARKTMDALVRAGTMTGVGRVEITDLGREAVKVGAAR